MSRRLARSGRGRGRGEAGLTLIELVVTIGIMGLAFVIVIGGIGTAIIGADLGRRHTSAESLLRTAAEEIKSTDLAYDDVCPATYALSVSPPPGYSATVDNVTYWDRNTNTFVTACASPDSGLQLVRIVVTAPQRETSTPTTYTVDVVKRKTTP